VDFASFAPAPRKAVEAGLGDPARLACPRATGRISLSVVLSNDAMSATDLTEPSLWDFAVAVYAAPGVPEACLALQDRHGCDVNVLLFAAWMSAVRCCPLSPGEIADAAASVEDWHRDVVRPLRGVRRRLKSGPPPAPDEATAALRTRIKSIEIEAERIELSRLELLAPKWHAGRREEAGQESLANLTMAVRHFARGAPSPEALEHVRTIGTVVETQMRCKD
jgi:uncharacterized protein (TIGR02444 family)